MPNRMLFRRGQPHRRPLPLSLFALAMIFSGLLLTAGRPVLPDAARTGFEAIRADEMRSILQFLASDELEGRGTAQRGLQIAARYLEAQYTLAGLQPPPGQKSMLQKFFVVESRLKPETRLMLKWNQNGARIERSFHLYSDFYVSGAGNNSFTIEAPVVFVGFGVVDSTTGYDDYRKVNVKGKIVLALSGIPNLHGAPDEQRSMRRRMASRRRKAQIAGERGALALVLVSNRSIPALMARFSRWLKRPSYSLEGARTRLPQFVVSEEAAEALLGGAGSSLDEVEKLMGDGKPHPFKLRNVRLVAEVKVDRQLKETQNVVAYLPGADPQLREEVVAFGAHYDHLGKTEDGTIYNGADDDGSGTTAILEIARAFARNPVRPKRSLLFISHTGEEKGLLGSRYFTEHPVIPLEKFQAMLNIDMIGRNEENRVYIIGSDFLSRELRQLNEAANEEIGLELDYRYNRTDDPQRFYYRSDHYNYAKHNVPIIFFFTGTHEDYHEPTDTVDKINFKKMEKIARLVYLTAWNAANLDHKLKLDGLLVK